MKMYKNIEAKSALNKLKRRIPYGWDLNIYRGCEHGCKYCYANGTHKYLGDYSFDSDIFIKDNIVEVLERELRSSSWNREIVNLGGVTDSYQPCERERALMPDVLKLFIKYRTPIIISTKSNLILRDYELIEQLAEITYVNIASTIITMDEKKRKKLEPNASSSIERFEVLDAFSKTKASVGLHVMPIIPYLTDSTENLDSIFSKGKESNVTYVLPGTLYLRNNKKEFMEFIKNEFPEEYGRINSLYIKGSAGKEYKDGLYLIVNELIKKYGLSKSYSKPIKDRLG